MGRGTRDDEERAHDLLEGYPVVVRLPVQWGEMDAFGHLNNVVYFRYFETARIRYLDECGFAESHRERHVGAILHSTSCRFRVPLTYPDRVDVGARVREVEEDRFTMEYRIVSLGSEAVAAQGEGIVVSFDYEAERKTTLPDEVRRRVREMEGWGPEG